jgi:peptidoglycan/LPS O-acetylase OafA/YrhL
MKRPHRPAVIVPPALQPSTDTKTGMQGRLVFIDALRGLAAVTIALHHINRYEPLTSANALLPEWLLCGLKEGRLAVQVFFVISGFMIARSLRQTVLTPAVMGRFSLRRFIRLGVPYWTILAAVLALDMLLPWLGIPPLNSEIIPEQLLSEVFFLQDIFGYGSTSTGLWFICIEVQFFLLFLVLLFAAQSMRRENSASPNASWFSRLAVFFPVALLSLFVFNVNTDYDAWVVYFFGAIFLGSMTYWTLDGSIPRAVFWLYTLAVSIRLALFPTLPLSAALAATVVIYAVGCHGGLNRWLSAGWLQYLGRISYSLFLVHYSVSHTVKWLAHRLTLGTPGVALVCLGLAFAASVVVAHFFYRWVEAPACRLAEQLKEPALDDSKCLARKPIVG